MCTKIRGATPLISDNSGPSIGQGGILCMELDVISGNSIVRGAYTAVTRKRGWERGGLAAKFSTKGFATQT